MREHVRVHVTAASELQRAVSYGRLADAHELAGWLATHQTEEPPSWSPYLEELRFAARNIERAATVAQAGAHLGRLGRACSSCHEALGAKVNFVGAPAPGDDKTLSEQMRRHAWGAERLWEGVVGPSNERWLEGARAIAVTQLDVADMMHDKPNAEVAELAEQLRDHTKRAHATRDHDARAVLFGEMMEMCASCHAIVRPRPVVGLRK